MQSSVGDAGETQEVVGTVFGGQSAQLEQHVSRHGGAV
jgi:hypothetical protein